MRFSLVRLKPKLLRLPTTWAWTWHFYSRELPTASLTIKHKHSGDRVGRQAQDLPARDRLLHCPGLQSCGQTLGRCAESGRDSTP